MIVFEVTKGWTVIHEIGTSLGEDLTQTYSVVWDGGEYE